MPPNPAQFSAAAFAGGDASMAAACGAGVILDNPGLPMEQRLSDAADRITSREGDLDIISPTRALRPDQVQPFRDVLDHFVQAAKGNSGNDRWSRLVMPPRVGKTVMAGHLIAHTGLCTAYLVPTGVLVRQTARELARVIPGVPIGKYYGEEKTLVPMGVNVVTYTSLRDLVREGEDIPPEIAGAALVFPDEGHHAMTQKRMDALKKVFHEGALRMAMTATPNYSNDPNRMLSTYFPGLAYEMPLQDAISKNLFAPLRFWLIEVGVDASKVRMIGEDFEIQRLGKVMSDQAFFETALTLRYAQENIQTPALITCKSVAQAMALHKYLTAKKPKHRPAPVLAFGKTSEERRLKIQKAFETGKIDTLIVVRLFLEGWDSARCKLLIDLSATPSMVLALQKFTRVLTRDGDTEARIYSLVPKNLRPVPVLPSDLLGPSLKSDQYRAGSVLGSHQQAGKGIAKEPSRESATPPNLSEIKEVKVFQNVLLSYDTRDPKLQRHDTAGIRQVLESEPSFTPDAPWMFHEFRRLQFRHRLFRGTGNQLLKCLGIPATAEGYLMLMASIFDLGWVVNESVGGGPRRILQVSGAESDMATEAMLLFLKNPQTQERKPKRASEQWYPGWGWRALGGVDFLDHETPEDAAERTALLKIVIDEARQCLSPRKFEIFKYELLDEKYRPDDRELAEIFSIKPRSLIVLRSVVFSQLRHRPRLQQLLNQLRQLG